MVLYDISMMVEPAMAVYKNKAEKRPQFEVARDFKNGSSYESRLGIDLHTGTHIDMPLHFIPDGASSEYFDPADMISSCLVLDFTGLDSDHITAADLKQKEHAAGSPKNFIGAGETVLLKTANSAKEHFDHNFTYLEKSGAAYLVEKRVIGVGIDALGIERAQPDYHTHKQLLSAGIWIMEGLRLKEVPEGRYTLLAMPLKIRGTEAMPARAVLLPPADDKL